MVTATSKPPASAFRYPLRIVPPTPVFSEFRSTMTRGSPTARAASPVPSELQSSTTTMSSTRSGMLLITVAMRASSLKAGTMTATRMLRYIGRSVRAGDVPDPLRQPPRTQAVLTGNAGPSTVAEALDEVRELLRHGAYCPPRDVSDLALPRAEAGAASGLRAGRPWLGGPTL